MELLRVKLGRAVMHATNRLREEPRRLRFLASRLLWRTGATRIVPLTIRLEGSTRLHFDRSSLAANLWLDPGYGREDRMLVRSLLRPGNIMVDVGANIGALALPAAEAVRPNGSVIAIEPHPRTFRYLEGNVRLNDAQDVICHNVAIAATSGELGLTDLHTDDQNFVTPVSAGAATVSALSLDELLADRVSSIALLKLDVEGFELFALEGAARTLEITDCVLFECWDDAYTRYDYTPSDVFELLEAAGLDVVTPTAGAPRADRNTVGQRCENLVAVRDVKRFRSLTADSSQTFPIRSARRGAD
jgi:FkbM family methyltransferase